MKALLIVVVFAAAIFFSGIFKSDVQAQVSDKVQKAFAKSLEYENNKKYKEALQELEKISSEAKNEYLVQLRLGWLGYLNEQYEKSEQYYRTASNLSAQSIEAQLGLTYPLSMLNKWSEIMDIYKNIIKKDAMNYTANLRLGQIYLNSGDYQQAKNYLLKVYTQYQADYETNLSLGWTMLYLGDKKMAKELFSKVLLLSPDDSSAKEGMKNL